MCGITQNYQELFNDQLGPTVNSLLLKVTMQVLKSDSTGDSGLNLQHFQVSHLHHVKNVQLPIGLTGPSSRSIVKTSIKPLQKISSII